MRTLSSQTNPYSQPFYLIKAALVLFRPQADRQKTIIYYSGPPQDSSLFSKAKRLAFKAVLRCMGGDISAVVAGASRRPRTFVLLSIGRWSHSALKDSSISIERQCRTSTSLILSLREPAAPSGPTRWLRHLADAPGGCRCSWC